MYRIKLQSGEESEFSSFEELCFGVVSGFAIGRRRRRRNT